FPSVPRLRQVTLRWAYFVANRRRWTSGGLNAEEQGQRSAAQLEEFGVTPDWLRRVARPRPGGGRLPHPPPGPGRGGPDLPLGIHAHARHQGGARREAAPRRPPPGPPGGLAARPPRAATAVGGADRPRRPRRHLPVRRRAPPGRVEPRPRQPRAAVPRQ